MSRPNLTFQVGDIVQVVDVPYEDCPFKWVEDMDEMCGKETTITRVDWYDGRKTYGYRISGDNGSCVWCENCFISMEPDLAESDAELCALLV